MSDLDALVQKANREVQTRCIKELRDRLSNLVSAQVQQALEMEYSYSEHAEAVIRVRGFPLNLKPAKARGAWELTSWWSQSRISERDGLFESNLLAEVGRIRDYIERMGTAIGPLSVEE